MTSDRQIIRLMLRLGLSRETAAAIAALVFGEQQK
jgi:hypothetical protein